MDLVPLTLVAAGCGIVGLAFVARGRRTAAAPVVPAAEPYEEPSYAATAYLSGEERSIVRRFLERRESLAPQARGRLAGRLAERVRPRLPADLARLDDEALLERL